MASSPERLLEAEKVVLWDGPLMPVMGLGTFQGSYDYGALTHKVQTAVEHAIDIGYRHFDTASLYKTEEGVGQAINKKIKEGVVTREELFVTTKLWCTDRARRDVEPALKKSLEKLQLDYVDNFLMHWPVAMPHGQGEFPKDDKGNPIFSDDETPIIETWQAMDQCKGRGLTKTIGVSNFNIKQLKELNERTSNKPSTNQVEVHPYFQNRELIQYCNRHFITIVAYCPLGKPQRDWRKPNEPLVFDDPVLQRIGRKYGKTAAQVALKFNLKRGISVIPKSSNPKRMRENLDIFSFEFDLTDEEMRSIYALDRGYDRVLSLRDVVGGSKNYPY